MSSIRVRDRFLVRVFRVFALSLLIISAAFTTVFVYGQAKVFKKDLLEDGETLARVLARGARTAVFAENLTLLGDSVQGILEKDYVLAVAILDKDLNPLVAQGKGAGGRSTATLLSPETIAILARLGQSRDLEIVEGAEGFDVWCPVTLRVAPPGSDALFFTPEEPATAEEVIGFVRISLDKAVLMRETGRMLRSSLALFFAFLLVGSVLVYLLARGVTAPLATLSAEVKLMGRTGVGEPISIRAGGEIGELAASFNAMVDGLKAREREKAQLEERLLEARKLEAVGTLARGVSHDFNNILATVKGAVHIMEKRFSDDPFLMRYTGKIQTSLGRAKELIDGLISFSRSRELHLAPLDLGRLITSLEPTLREIAGDGVRLEIVLPREGLRVRGDDLGLKQVLMNLVTNARDAMPGGGRLRILAELVSGGQEDDDGDPLRPTGPLVRLAVSDTGAGMEEAVRERIFEPFFTTKEVGRGTGLGLAIVHGIVEQHHGRITVRSEPGRGTEFRIELPGVEENAAATV